MPYTTAIFDRTRTDITNRTSKAFFNVSTWDRIEDNAVFVRDELVFVFGPVIIFTGPTSAPTITSIPDVDDFNRLLENIEYLRQAALSVMPGLSSESGFAVIAHDWEAGASKDAPDYTDVNRWEKVIDLIHQTLLAYQDFIPGRQPRTGIASAGADLTRNNMFRS